MKGIILAGGKGSRLYPITKSISKQILPIYDKPMIYYPLSVLMMIGITEILIISTERDIKLFKDLLLDGKQLGIDISYKVQKEPKGIAESFIIGEEFIDNDEVALILGDNIFYSSRLENRLIEAKESLSGAIIFACPVSNSSDFGIVEFDKNNKIISIEEKPKNPRSNYAVPGLYFYNNKVIDIAKSIKPSLRGELEITSINEEYLKRNELSVIVFDKEMLWLDTGTHKNLLKASNLVKDIQENGGRYVGCIEEISFRKGYITKEQLIDLALDTAYREYLLQCINVSKMDKTICNKYKGSISFDNIILRPIGIDDIEIIRTWRNIENNNRLFKSTQYITKESQEKWYANYIDDETDIMFMISYKNILVGTVAIYNIDYQKGIGEFGRILISEEVRGNGIGLKVTENLCKYVFENLGLNKIKLEVFKDNIRAVNLYKSLGFKSVNTEIYDNREIILMEIYYNK